MAAALATLASLPTQGRRIAVLGKMGELGDAAADGYRTVGELAAKQGIDSVVAVGGDAQSIGAAARDAGCRETISTANTDEAARWLSEFSRAGDLILVKGSRSAGMERVLTSLADLFRKSAEPAAEESSAPMIIR